MSTQAERDARLATGVEWKSRAACRGLDPDLFHPVGEKSKGRSKDYTTTEELQAAAAQFCHDVECPVLQDCRDYAIRNGLDTPEHGIWGGMTPVQRRTYRRRLQRQRREEKTA